MHGQLGDADADHLLELRGKLLRLRASDALCDL
jgi:hypothetical protein